jgi:hypothetical protein
MPVKNLKITVDTTAVLANKVVPDNMRSRVVKEMRFTRESDLLKNDLMVLDIVASNLWERPIYFAVSVDPDAYVGLNKYFQLEGLAYRIVPVEDAGRSRQSGYVAADIMYDNVMNKFRWGAVELKDTVTYTVQQGDTKESVAKKFKVTELSLPAEVKEGETIKITIPNPLYLDENTLRMTTNLRSNFGRLAETYINFARMEKDSVKAQAYKEKAKDVIQRCLAVMPPETVPYDHIMVQFTQFLYILEEKEQGRSLSREIAKMCGQELDYYLDPEIYRKPGSAGNSQMACAMLEGIMRTAITFDEEFARDELQTKYGEQFTACQSILEK